MRESDEAAIRAYGWRIVGAPIAAIGPTRGVHRRSLFSRDRAYGWRIVGAPLAAIGPTGGVS